MKKTCTIILMVLSWAAWAVVGCGEPSQGPAYRLHIPSSLGTNAAQRLTRFVDQNTDVPVERTELFNNTPERPGSSGDVLPPVLGHIALFEGASAEGQATLVVSNQLAIIYLGDLQAEDQELFLQRVERYLMRAATELAGLPPCPQPLCARCSGLEVFGVDRIGRNTCPPCRIALKEMALARGIRSLDPLRFVPEEIRQKLLNAQKKDEQ